MLGLFLPCDEETCEGVEARPSPVKVKSDLLFITPFDVDAGFLPVHAFASRDPTPLPTRHLRFVITNKAGGGRQRPLCWFGCILAARRRVGRVLCDGDAQTREDA